MEKAKTEQTHYDTFRAKKTADPAGMITASIILLTFNSEKTIQEVLDAVFSQRVSFSYEVIVVDSGSTDRTRALLSPFPVRLFQIDQSEFNHGDTRNYAAEQAKGKYLVYLTDDARPASAMWLEEMIHSFSAAPNIANVFGKHLPRVNCSPTIRRDMEETFRMIGGGKDEQTVYKIQKGERGWEEYLKNKERMRFNSDVNAAYLRTAWEEVRFRHIDYAEDQIIGQDILEAGFSRVYNPKAEVYHSHSYPIKDFLRRYYDEYRGLNNAFGYVDGVNILTLLPATLHGWWKDSLYILHRTKESLSKKMYWIVHAFLMNLFRRIGAFLGGRHSTLPTWITSRLSLEKKRVQTASPRERRLYYAEISHLSKKAIFTYRTQGIAGTIRGLKKYIWFRRWASPEHQRVILRGQTPSYSFITDYNPLVPTSFLPKPLAQDKALTIHWIIPDFKIGSGGHMTIFRIIQHLEKRGHINRLYLFDAGQRLSYKKASDAKEVINKHFFPLRASCEIGVQNMPTSDILVATSWHTAYPAYRIHNTKQKYYFIQDFEPRFYPRGSEYTFAEQTYGMGYHCITAGPWLSSLLKKEYGIDTRSFNLAYDKEHYTPQSRIEREKKTVLFYARFVTSRRGFELGILALSIMKQKRPDIDIILFGWDTSNQAIPFEHMSLGVLSPDRLCTLYAKATLGVVFSMTNYSLIPQEMMACGLPVLEVKGENTEAVYTNGKNIALVEPNAYRIAEKIIQLIDNPNERQFLSQNAYRWVREFQWERSAEEVETAFYEMGNGFFPRAT